MSSRLSFEFHSSNQQALLLTSLEKLSATSVLQINDIKQQLIELTNDKFPLSIQKRRTGIYDQYFWRFKSNNSTDSRRFVRLYHEDLEDYLETCGHDFTLQLKRIEEKLIKLNANLRLIATLTAIVIEYNEQTSKLFALQTAIDYGIAP